MYITCNCYPVLSINNSSGNDIFFLNKCLTCMASSNKFGEIIHTKNCIFNLCIHSINYHGVNPWWDQGTMYDISGSQILDKKYKKRKSSYFKDRLTYEDEIGGVLNLMNKWSSHQPSIKIRKIHLDFRKTLYDNIAKQMLIIDQKRMKLVYKIIEIKTGIKLY